MYGWKQVRVQGLFAVLYVYIYICMYVWGAVFAIRTRRTRATRCCSCYTVSVSTGPCRVPRRSSSSASSRARTCPRWTTAGISATLRRSMIDWGCLDLHNGRFDSPFCIQYTTYIHISSFYEFYCVEKWANCTIFFHTYMHTYKHTYIDAQTLWHIIYTYKQTYIHSFIFIWWIYDFSSAGSW